MRVPPILTAHNSDFSPRPVFPVFSLLSLLSPAALYVLCPCTNVYVPVCLCGRGYGQLLNLALEKQAVGRVYRLGQERPVTVRAPFLLAVYLPTCIPWAV